MQVLISLKGLHGRRRCEDTFLVAERYGCTREEIINPSRPGVGVALNSSSRCCIYAHTQPLSQQTGLQPGGHLGHAQLVAVHICCCLLSQPARSLPNSESNQASQTSCSCHSPPSLYSPRGIAPVLPLPLLC